MTLAEPKQVKPIPYESVKRLWKRANDQSSASMQNRWHVGRQAYKTQPYTKGAAVQLAKVIAEAQGETIPDEEEKTPTDTVYRLRNAYCLFVELLQMDNRRAMSYRRKYSYTRFDTVWKQWLAYEFEKELFWSYLDYNGGNRAVALFIDDTQNPQEEWERRSNRIYKEAVKLQNDFGVPAKLQEAAGNFVKEFDNWNKRSSK